MGRHKSLDILQPDPLHLRGDALRRHAPGGGIVQLPQGRHRPVRRIVLGAGEILQHHLPGRLPLVGGEQRPPQDISINRQRDRQLPGHHRPGKTGMARGNRLCPLHPGPLERINDLPAAAVARPTQHHLAREGGQAAAARAVMHGAGGGVERDRHRFQARKFLAEQHDAVVECCRKDGLLHRLPPLNALPHGTADSMAANSPKSSGGQFRRRDTDSSRVGEKMSPLPRGCAATDPTSPLGQGVEPASAQLWMAFS